MTIAFSIGQLDYITQLNALVALASTTTYTTTAFAIYDTTDTTKIAKFDCSGFTTATTNTYTLPNASGTLGLLNQGQTWTGNNIFNAANSTFGGGTANGTINLGTGATANGNTKTVNIGTGVVGTATTNINIGPSSGTVTITFNAAPVSATGYKIGTTLSSDVNTLDYYQEGTFTPVVAGTTTAGAGTYTTQNGKYTRVGNVVTFVLEINQTAHTGTGNMIVTGLPFTSQSTIDCPVDIRATNLTFSNQLSAVVPKNTTQINLETFSTGAGVAALAMDTSCNFWISGTYLL